MMMTPATRRAFLKGTSCATLAALAGCAYAQPEQPGKPNIVYILADDLGYGELGCFGQQKIESPNIDRLCRSGMRFTAHYSGSPVCAPSRCALMTGRHTGHAYIRGNDEWASRGKVWDYQAMFDNPNLEGQRPLHLYKNKDRVLLKNDLVTPGVKLAEGADPLNPASYARFTQTDDAPDLMFREIRAFVTENRSRPFFLYWEYPEVGGQQAVRLGKWKLIRTGLRKGELKTALYDLESDLREEHDVAAQHPEILSQMETILRASHTPPALDAFKMKALGD